MIRPLLLAVIMVGLVGCASKIDRPKECINGTCNHNNKMALPMHGKVGGGKVGRMTFPERDFIVMTYSCDYIRNNP